MYAAAELYPGKVVASTVCKDCHSEISEIDVNTGLCYPCFSNFIRGTKHLSMEQCLKRYPRLSWHMMAVAILSSTEAGACLRDYRDGFKCSGEAVNHYGGTLRVIQDAIRSRHINKRIFNVENLGKVLAA